MQLVCIVVSIPFVCSNAYVLEPRRHTIASSNRLDEHLTVVLLLIQELKRCPLIRFGASTHAMPVNDVFTIHRHLRIRSQISARVNTRSRRSKNAWAKFIESSTDAGPAGKFCEVLDLRTDPRETAFGACGCVYLIIVRYSPCWLESAGSGMCLPRSII